MKNLNKTTFISAYAALWMAGAVSARDVVQPKMNAAVQEYCHVVRFPSGWQNPYPLPKFHLSHDYEFGIPGLLGTTFLVRGVSRPVTTEYPTTNLYAVNFSDPKTAVRPASEEEWNSATIIRMPIDTDNSGVRLHDRRFNYVEFQGRHFVKTGQR
jgi:hypothetical protein